MAYSEKQSKAKAQQIFDKFGSWIHRACSNSVVAEEFLAGFVGVEAGIDSHGNIKSEATRFEPGVYQDLISLRDNGYCFVGGKKRSTYSGVTQSQIKDADDEAIRALATSYGMSQIMGWHVINNLKCTIAELRDPEKHFFYTIQLLLIGESGIYLKRGDLTAVLHIWNTGTANGKTYHEDYVTNALQVRAAYRQILKANENDFSNATSAVGNVSRNSAAISSAMPDTNAEDEPNGNAASGSDVPTQNAENITNVNNAPKTLPDNFKPEDKTVNAPAPSGMMRKAWLWIVGLGIVPTSGSAVFETIRNYASDGSFNLKDSLLIAGQVGKFIFPYVVIVGIAFIVIWGIKELLKQISLIVKIYVTGRADMHNVEVKPFYQPGEWINAPVECEPEKLEVWKDGNSILASSPANQMPPERSA